VLAFAHGFNVHYGQVVPRADLDVIMVAPKPRATPCARPTPRAAACRIAVYQDKSGIARDIACRTHRPTAAAVPASSKPTSAKKPKPTCSANKPCCAAAPWN
jgi:ketol-acid reductoisomerase